MLTTTTLKIAIDGEGDRLLCHASRLLQSIHSAQVFMEESGAEALKIQCSMFLGGLKGAICIQDSSFPTVEINNLLLLLDILLRVFLSAFQQYEQFLS